MAMTDLRFWQGKKVLITGHTGFKGAWLSLWLQELGADVVGYALTPPSDPNLFTIARVGEGMSSVIGDVLDRDKLRGVIDANRPEIVFHMAAQALVRTSYQDPVGTYATNVMGLVHLLESVRIVGGVRAVVCVTSDKCYQNRGWLWGYREDEPMGGYDPYSSSKGCSELVAAAYRTSFFNPEMFSQHRVAVATARAGNVIGGGDWARDRLVPDVVRALLTGKEIVLRNPDAVRPWQHVIDPLCGYLILAENLYKYGPRFGEGWNFAPLDTQPVRHVVDRLLSLWSSNIGYRSQRTDLLHEDHHIMLDSTKARVKLGWQQVLDLDTTLCWVVEWTKAFAAGSDMRSLVKSQIARYQDLAARAGLAWMYPNKAEHQAFPGQPK